MNVTRNPIVLGILSGAMVYLYLFWQEEQKQSEDELYERKPVSILIPGIVSSFVWFITGCMVSSEKIPYSHRQSLPENCVIHKLGDKIELECDNNSTLDSKSFRMVGRGQIQLPNQDVFLDLANF